ncbi:MAG: hypothetical protein K6E40_15960 [Desulfovibrio sp.]|nr:hypothetical protein [Desulfovibrio sp.]
MKDGLCTVYAEGESFKAGEKVIALYRSASVREALEKAVCKPQAKEGGDSFICADKQKSELGPIIVEEEAVLFACPQGKAEDLPQEECETSLQLLSPNFQEGSKRRFSDGSAGFFAKVSDQKFLDRVNSGNLVFGKGGIMQVKIRGTRQGDLNGSMSSEKEVIQVIKHRHPIVHIPLPGIGESNSSYGNWQASGLLFALDI